MKFKFPYKKIFILKKVKGTIRFKKAMRLSVAIMQLVSLGCKAQSNSIKIWTKTFRKKE